METTTTVEAYASVPRDLWYLTQVEEIGAPALEAVEALKELLGEQNRINDRLLARIERLERIVEAADGR